MPSTPGKNKGSETPIKTAPTKKPGKFSKLFAEVAKVGSREVATAWVFALALGTVVVWAVSGPFFGFSDTWQLVINTGTTIVTFLMVFLIQNTQNRDTGAIQTKLDELIRAIEGAHNALLDLEELDDSEIEHIRRDYRNLATEARKAIEEGMKDTDCREIKHEIEEARSKKH